MTIVGLMSGTSLDGLDIALCRFENLGSSYSYKVYKAATIEYSEVWKKTLHSAKDATAENYFALNHEYGAFIAEQVNEFLKGCSEKPDAIASHGHTIFHRPGSGFSTQLGSGATIAAKTGITTVCDFRSLDVANEGQGAPLVPIGDKLLFAEYDACLNIGGIANISFDNKKGERIAFDICFANMTLNYLAEKLGLSYDENGSIAASGTVNQNLLSEIQKTLFVNEKFSLAREQFETMLLPILEGENLSIENKLATFCDYIALEITDTLKSSSLKKVLITGGGAFNKHLIRKISQHYDGEIIIPDNETIQFKEALIFAFLGYLRLQEKVNTLKSVTKAKSDSIGGAVYLGTRTFFKDFS